MESGATLRVNESQSIQIFLFIDECNLLTNEHILYRTTN